MTQSAFAIQIDVDETAVYAAQLRELLDTQAAYPAAKRVAAEFLGGRPLGPDKALFGFWVPGLTDGAIAGQADRFTLELLTPLEPIDFRALKKGHPVTTPFQRDSLGITAVDDVILTVVSGVQIGTQTECGSFYWLRYDDGQQTHIIRDVMAASLPFGIYAPAELFDMAGMLADRRDMAYFQNWYKTILPDGSIRAKDIGTHLEIHPETATEAGTIEALTQRYQQIAQKLQANIDAGAADIYANLSPADRNFIGFDTIELTPEVPTGEREAITHPTGEFFQIQTDSQNQLTIQLKRPDISNWGYDTPVLGSAAVSPSLLGTLRPNELLEFIETIHTMPDRPIQLCIDSVLGHCDFQGAGLLRTFEQPSPDTSNKYVNSKYLRGPNMYGRDIDFAEPTVKAILLELLVRKLNFGFDCVRVDGAQDFIIGMDQETGLRVHDDLFLNEMANVSLNINGLIRRPDMNLEDGRPWPDDLNWLYNSKYLDHTIERTLPYGDRVKQWSPIIFAHNVHGKYKWFMNKWDRFVEVYRYGENWITGHSNHDNVRYFYRLVPMTPASEYRPGQVFDDFYNDQLGDTLKEAAHNAMDSNALTALSLGFLPGNPMFMLNALFRTPWGLIRDIDDTYSVKIVADEAMGFFSWYVDEALFDLPDKFRRLKALGFSSYRQLVAPPEEKTAVPGFIDRIYQLGQQIKTDALMARYLYDEVEDAGGFATVEDLRRHYETLAEPQTEEQRAYRQLILDRIAQAPSDHAGRVGYARGLMYKTNRYLQRDRESAREDLQPRIDAQLNKLSYLASLPDEAMALLLEEANLQTEYNVAMWAQDDQLNKLAAAGMKPDGQLTAVSLKSFAIDFLHDMRDAAKVHQYEAELDPAQADFNFRLRKFRQENPWLLNNPTNDVQRDYFARKLYINGAKDVGDWGDRGDIVKCNTIYYGWRTSPDNNTQVFLIANMEGKPIEHCPLNLFLNLKGGWKVVAASPSMGDLPEVVDHRFVLKNFSNGQALLLTR